VSTPGKMACVLGEILRTKLRLAPNAAPRRG
jgi:hypothetical protein